MNQNKVFLNAPVFQIEKNNQPVFEEMQSKLWKYELEVFSPGLILEKLDKMDVDEYTKRCSRTLVYCDLMVTHGDWYSFPECVRLVELARLLKIEVIHEFGIKVWADQKRKV